MMKHCAAMALSDYEPANGEAKHSHHCECFDAFHTILSVLLSFPRFCNCMLPVRLLTD